MLNKMREPMKEHIAVVCDSLKIVAHTIVDRDIKEPLKHENVEDFLIQILGFIKHQKDKIKDQD